MTGLNRRAASAVIEQPDGPNRMGHDDACHGEAVVAARRRKRALLPG
jgi:hypothetical protein